MSYTDCKETESPNSAVMRRFKFLLAETRYSGGCSVKFLVRISDNSDIDKWLHRDAESVENSEFLMCENTWLCTCLSHSQNLTGLDSAD